MQRENSHSESAEARLALFDFAFDHAPIGIAILDRSGRIIRGNQAFSRLLERPVETLEGTPFTDFTHPDDLDADLTLFNSVLAGERDGYSIEKRYIRHNGDAIHVLIHIAAMRDNSGKVIRFLSQIQNISAQKEGERQLAEKAAQLELAMEAVRGGFWHMDVAAGRFETSDRLAKFIAGPDAARLDLEMYLKRVNPEDSRSADLTPLIKGEIDQSCAEYRLDTVLGERWMRCDRRLLRNADGSPRRIVGVAIDFTEETLRMKEFELRSETDALTGLLNRRGLTRLFLQNAPISGRAVLAMDLDGFKKVNDTHGHSAGDRVLVEAALRLRQQVEGKGLLSRTGGDEFVIVLNGNRDMARCVARQIVEAMRLPINTGDAVAQVQATIGGVWTEDSHSLTDLLEQADALLYEAKTAGKNQWILRDVS